MVLSPPCCGLEGLDFDLANEVLPDCEANLMMVKMRTGLESAAKPVPKEEGGLY